jgi:molecular chaperone GrpE
MTDKENKAEEKQKKEEPKEDIEKIKREKDEYLDGWKRAKADLINYKKDELKRLEEIVRFSNEGFILELITVLDSFEFALASMVGNPAEKGFFLIKSKIEDVLKRYGVTKIEVEAGQNFNPSYHEAVGTVDIKEGETHKPDTIAEEFETGYMLYSKVLRPARIKVYK